jgi:hypothetical protein
VSGSRKVGNPKSKPKRIFDPFEVVVIIQVIDRKTYHFKRVKPGWIFEIISSKKYCFLDQRRNIERRNTELSLGTEKGRLG